MAPSPYHGKVFRLKKHCVLVHVCEPDQPDPLSVPVQIINMGVTPHQRLELSDTAAFILRFLLMRVDTNLIKDLLISEYVEITDDTQANAKISEFIDHYMKTTEADERVLEIKEISPRKPVGQIKPTKKEKFQKPLKLDFTVGSVGWTVFKLPLR